MPNLHHRAINHEAAEQHALKQIQAYPRVSRNVNVLAQERLSFGDWLADRIAQFGGSWTFIGLFGLVLLAWMGINSVALIIRPFDPFPFIFLNLILSCLAAIQAPVIMMSQNRQAARDRLKMDHDYAVNLKAELEIEQLHKKLDSLRERQWAELVAIQDRQIELLERIVEAQSTRGTPSPKA